ncbi:hypothetical protein LTR70_004068 [Exophiala xenobiotica]|uniref:Uncharacterized protein n=1 Tax=Lithohypha guttulata TaxID=1690604 RepID=A0ABR0KEL0_9EURO|nr:hypothetical protein LTR24_003488 [Lithohypha guttulata]KAK5321678.1 hypothetical protein LTR70_004068 [Exophiala xenobiotica]
MSPDTSAQQSLKIPVPTSLSQTTPSLPPLTSQLLVSHLRSQTNTIPELQSLLSDSLARTGWTDRVRALALELLRSGKCDSFPDLFEEVLHRAKVPRDAELKSEDKEPTSRTGGKTIPGQSQSQKDKDPDGTSTPTSSQNPMNGNGAIAVRDGWFGPDGLPDVKIPVAAVEAGADFLRGKVRHLVEIVEDD